MEQKLSPEEAAEQRARRTIEHAEQVEKNLKAAPHPSVANVHSNALNFVEAAEHALAKGCPVHANYLIGVAEGIAMVLREVPGVNAATPRETAVLSKVHEAVSRIRLAVTRAHPESSVAE